MEPRIIRRTVELRRDAQDVERLGILAYTDNRQGHRLELTLLCGGEPADMSGYAARATYLIGAGQAMKLVVDAEIAGNVVRATFPAQAYAAGQTTLVVTAEAEGESIPLYAGCFLVRSGEADALIDPEDIVPDLQELLAQIDAMEAATGAANTAAASANTAASKADSAATSATSAASSANAAAASATSAAQTATTAAQTANTAAGKADTATNNANNAAGSANTAAGRVDTAIDAATSAAAKIDGMTVTVETLAEGSNATAALTESGGAYQLALGIPRGDTGAVDGIDYYTGTPAALGTGAPGTANGVARGDHVHPMPTAADIGALAEDAAAADADKLGGKAPDAYVLHDDALGLDDIQASSDLTGKIPTAQAVSELSRKGTTITVTNVSESIAKDTWAKTDASYSLEAGKWLFVCNFFRDRGGEDSSFSVGLALSAASTYTGDMHLGAMTKNWGTVSLGGYVFSVPESGVYNIFVRHSASASHVIDLRGNFVKL